jgi:pyridoxine kinase
MHQQTILSIQSCVSFGHVGNSAITFPLQKLGVEVWPIHTVLFSNHTGYGQWGGKIIDPETVRQVFLGIENRNVLPQCNALLTGYMGSQELGCVMKEILERLKIHCPHLIYCCDPVMGDEGRGFFVQEGIPKFFKEIMLPLATFITPNHFELEYLSEMKINCLETAMQAAHKMIKKGPQVVVVTSLRLEDEQQVGFNKTLHVLALSQKEAYLITTPYVPVHLNGTGDLTSALFTHFYMRHNSDLKKALEDTVSRVFCIIEETYALGLKELTLIQGQKHLLEPRQYFSAQKIEKPTFY